MASTLHYLLRQAATPALPRVPSVAVIRIDENLSSPSFSITSLAPLIPPPEPHSQLLPHLRQASLHCTATTHAKDNRAIRSRHPLPPLIRERTQAPSTSPAHQRLPQARTPASLKSRLHQTQNTPSAPPISIDRNAPPPLLARSYNKLLRAPTTQTSSASKLPDRENQPIAVSFLSRLQAPSPAIAVPSLMAPPVTTPERRSGLSLEPSR